MKLRRLLGDAVWSMWPKVSSMASITESSRQARSFSAFGAGSVLCFPPTALFGQHGIRIGAGVLIGPYVALSAGMVPGQRLVSDRIVTIGDGCLIGRHSSIVGHFDITIEDGVYFGPNVFVTDQNHATADRSLPIGRQAATEVPVRVGAGSWIGANAVILPGSDIGRHVVIGAGSVVNGPIEDNSVAVGAPARVIDTRP